MSRWLISALRPSTPGAGAAPSINVAPGEVAAANASANHAREDAAAAVSAAAAPSDLLAGEYREDLDFSDMDEDEDCLEGMHEGVGAVTSHFSS